MEIEDQERNKFEKWLKSQPHVLNVGFNKSTQQYLLDEDQDMWVAWQARAELSLKADARIEDLEVYEKFAIYLLNQSKLQGGSFYEDNLAYFREIK